MLHGYAEHLGRYDEVVDLLLGGGFDCDLLDLRGHGRSGGTRGYVPRFEAYRDDLDRFLAESPWAKPPATGIPLPRLVLGHSLGGLITLSYVLHRPGVFAALAVTSPFLAPALDVPAYKRLLGEVAARITPHLSLPGEIPPAMLTHDTERVRLYQEDPLVFDTVNPRWFLEALEAQAELDRRAPEIRLPSLFLLAGDDHIADSEHSREIFERLGSTDKELHVYPGLYHEVLNEVGRQQVFGDLLSWLESQVSAPPGPG